MKFHHLLILFGVLTQSPLVRSVEAQEGSARRIADLNPGSVGSFPSNFTTFGGSLYFTAYTFELGREFWRYSNGVITLVSNINDNASDLGGGMIQGHDSVPDHFTLFNGALYFSAYDERRGGELWRYDGAQVQRVADINPDMNDTIKLFPKSSWPQELTVMNNALYFSADGGSVFFPNYELWRYDGVRATMVTNIHPNFETNHSSYPHELTVFNNALYFVADDGARGYELWRYDGTRAVLFADINQGTNGSYPKRLTQFNQALYFRALDDVRGYELWKTDGTNTTLVVDLNPTGSSLPDFFTVFKNALYFGADDGTNGFELWKYDGAAVTRVADINPAGSSAVKNLTVFGDHLYLAADDGVHGWELWRCDGINVALVADMNPGDHSYPEQFIVWNNRLFFSASNALSGYEMWMFDGKAASMMADIFPGAPSSFPFYPTGFGPELLVSANDGYFSDWELWAMTIRPFRITRLEHLGGGVRLTWRAMGGVTNVVQSAENLSGPFTDVSPQIRILGTSDTSTNYTDDRALAGRTRFYRIVQP